VKVLIYKIGAVNRNKESDIIVCNRFWVIAWRYRYVIRQETVDSILQSNTLVEYKLVKGKTVCTDPLIFDSSKL